MLFYEFYFRGQGETDYHGSNGQADTHSLHSSHLSVQDDPLLIRTHKQQTSQQVSFFFHLNTIWLKFFDKILLNTFLN